ncbi:MAG: hypothetical protein RMI01_10040 [Thermodesulfovibrio sp.]|nr:hypothetical protein [Thermodesulfovibrio sp.]
MNNIEILASTKFLKCRFCRYSEDDPERFTTVGQGNIKDPDHDFVYYEETDTLEEATIYTPYAYVECPTLKCSQLLIPNVETLEDLKILVVRTVETVDDEILKEFPYGESINIYETVETGTVMCYECGYYRPNIEQEVELAIVYDTGFPIKNHMPFLEIRCKPVNCRRGISIPEPGRHFNFMVQLKESELLKKLGITVEPFKEIKTYNVEERQEKILEALQEILNKPEVKKENLLRWKFQSLLGKRVKIVLKEDKSSDLQR